MTVENISRSISTKVWYLARIKLVITESVIKLATDCTMGPGDEILVLIAYGQKPPLNTHAGVSRTCFIICGGLNMQ